MNRRTIGIAVIAVAVGLSAAFVWRPALFGFYGFSRNQCVFLFAGPARTATQAELIAQQCTIAHSHPKRASTRSSLGTDEESTYLDDRQSKTPAEAFGLGATGPEEDSP